MINSELLIQSLVAELRFIINKVGKFRSYDMALLTWRESENAWNILECMEHLNLYGDYYLPQIAWEIINTETSPDMQFNHGLLGGYFAKSMLHQENMLKIKTFKSKNPLNTNLDKEVIDRFINQQIKLLDLLHQSREVSLNKVKIKTSISSLLRFKLGDTFQFLINHINRHLSQMKQIEAMQKNNTL